MCGTPPEVAHGRPMGSSRGRYPVNSIVRYQCDPGYTQRHQPVIHCMANGLWQEPQVECAEGEFLICNIGPVIGWRPVQGVPQLSTIEKLG